MRSAALLTLVAAVLAAGSAASAAPGRIAVGILAGASPEAVAAAAEAATGGAADLSLQALDALVVSVPDREAALEVLAGLPGVEYVEPVTRSRSLFFEPTDPLVSSQWYLDAIEAFDFWPERPALNPVRVAVIDSGIDGSHPEFGGRIAASRSFVGGQATVDQIGHGTMVAGEIAAALDNAEGIAGVAFPAELVVAKVVGPGGRISIEAEAKAIRWAADEGARVINLSLGGRRDPTNPAVDTYSALEQAAIEYAYERGAVVVAATGNCEDVCPYRYASYPAALPHVVGVSALRPEGTVPAFSNRDPVFNDLAAPGAGIVSTFPLGLSEPACTLVGYSICAGESLRNGNGTSFAAPLVAAAAALIIAELPDLAPSQVTAVLEGSAVDILAPGRDSLSGNGRLSVAGALSTLTQPLLPPDLLETNDDAGDAAPRLYGSGRSIRATIDYFDDPSDVYRVYLRAGWRLRLRLTGPLGTRPQLVVWRPGTEHVTAVTRLAVRSGSVLAHERGRDPELTYTARRNGWHYVEVKAPRRAGGVYNLVISKRKR